MGNWCQGRTSDFKNNEELKSKEDENVNHSKNNRHCNENIPMGNACHYGDAVPALHQKVLHFNGLEQRHVPKGYLLLSLRPKEGYGQNHLPA
ncbi:hypothetical protein [Pedobacter nototheniae]|uniref:hypothetical protein n=1 Tax=Pedobacter nototheniae TaxID=2488994 RepID=UPI00103F0E8B|nr:hypothetical protein [Pedobacter nototheniae]